MGYDMLLVEQAEGRSRTEIYDDMIALRQQGAEDTDPRITKLYEELDADRSYFRLNIWGMEKCRRLMLHFGMVYPAPQPDFPEPASVGLTDEQWFNGDPHDPATWSEAHQRLQDAFDAVAGTVGDEPGIPLFKFGSNDGWWVRPGECRSAVQLYEAMVAGNPSLTDAIKEAEAEDWWDKWIAWLRTAAEHGGFKVH